MEAMEDILEKLDVCRSVIGSLLGRSCVKHSVDIIINLRAVEIGLKPSFLFDFACVPSQKMIRFLESLQSHNVLKCPLAVLDIEEDLFIFHPDHLRSHLECISRELCGSCGLELVDVSSSLPTARALNNERRLSLLDEMSSALSAALLINDSQSCTRGSTTISKINSASGPGVISLNLNPSVNRTSVFGLLLGYPVIYWYETHREGLDGQICLDMVPLKVHKISVDSFQCGNQNQPAQKQSTVCLYSFSYPDSLQDQLKIKVEEWLENLKLSNSVQLKFMVETVVLPSVSM